MRKKSRKLNPNTPLGIWLIAACSSVALTAAVVLFAARTVHADARLSQTVVATTGVLPATPLSEPIDAEQVAVQAQRAAIDRGDRLHGIASWYGGVFNGRKTASGETYDMYAMTACHNTLPFGSLVKVINRKNHRSVVVKITDRGDLVKPDRIIDLSYGAAKKLAMVKPGLAKVDLQVLRLGEPQDN